MLHCSLVGDTDSRTDGVGQVGSLPDNPATIGIIDAAFSLEVTQGQARKTLEFLIDGDTEVEGKLQIGSQAMVECRPWTARTSQFTLSLRPPLA